MANYKVGDLDVTISGVSKDAVSSLDEVIKQLDTLQGKLGIVGKGFSGAFKVNNAATRAVIGDLGDIVQTTRNATDSQQELADVIQNGQASATRALEETRQEVRRTSEEYDNLFKTYRRISDYSKDKGTLFSDIKTAEENVKSAEDALKSLQSRLVSAFEHGSTELAFRLLPELDKATERVEKLKDRVGELHAAFGAPFNEAQAQVSALKSELLNVAFATGNISTATVDEITELSKKIAQTSNEVNFALRGERQAVEEINEAFKRMAMTEQELALYDFQQENAIRKQRIAYLNLMLATEQAGEKTAEYKRELRQLIKEQENADKVAGKSAKGGISKLIKQIGKIALYRTIRRGLQLITQTFKESIQAYAQVDDNINKTMSQLTSSTKIIQLSLGTVILPIIQAITPAVQQLSVGFANMANAINKSMALAQGNATYTKINTDALKDYRKELNKTSGALFDFDKFRALSNKQDTASIFLSTEDVSALDKAESKYSGIYTLVSGIGDILAQVLRLTGQIFDAASPIIDVVFKIAGWLLKGVGYVLQFANHIGLIEPILYGVLTVLGIIGATKIITFITNGSLVSGIKAIGTAIKNVNTTTLAWGAALAAVTAAFYILSNWDDFNRGTKIAITVISGLATALLAAATAAMALHGTLTLGTAIPLITAAVASGVVFVRGLVDIPNYAVGASDIDSGTVFRAGEAGKTEAVFTGSNGKTNVANVQQMYQAEYMAVLQALKDYGAARGEMPQLQPASDSGIYQAASRGARKVGKTFGNV